MFLGTFVANPYNLSRLVCLLVWYHNPKMNTVHIVLFNLSFLFLILSHGVSYSCSVLDFLWMRYFLSQLSHFTGQFKLSVCVFFPLNSWLRPHSVFHFLSTSCVGSSEQSNVSPRVRDQSEAPISPTIPPLLMLEATERAVGSPAATQIQPARARTRPWATVSHCVSFQLSCSHRAAAERRTKGGSRRERDEGIEAMQ